MSSPRVFVHKPPTFRTASRRKMPNAPEMISSAPMRLHPALPRKNARAYSTICSRSTQRRGMWSSPGRPSTIVAPFSGRTVPPTAITVSSFTKFRVARRIACASRRQSESTGATSGYRARLMPAFTASALPPFTFSATTRPGSRSERITRVTGCVGSVRAQTRGSSTSANASISRSIVPSVEPSDTTMTSNFG